MLRATRLSPAVIFFLLLPAAPLAANTVRVPQDVKDIQQAINTVSDGGVIEVSANAYKTPPRGYSIENERKGFTIRAMGGAVVLDGQGVNQLLRYENGKRDRGKLVTFEGITFRDGFSETEAYAGGVTMSAAEALFVGCTFEDNQATGRTSGGGAVRINAGSEARFADTSFRGNSSLNRGGAIEIIESTVTLQGGELADNRTNLPGHKPHSSGGAIYLLHGTLKASGVHFRGNQAGWTGGAIYAFGVWTDPDTTPRSLVQVSRSTFENNQALPDPGVAVTGPTTGGAIHIEDQSTLEIDSSVLSGNVAEFGGAVDSYRGLVAVRGSWFVGNRTPLTGNFTGAGGAIQVSSVDFADSSTGAGAFNRRPARITISDSLLQGATGGIGSVAHTGGCLLAAGDGSRVYGENGLPPAGTLEENRARVEIRRSVFADCDIEPKGNLAGSGGAVQADLVDLLMEDSMVLDSDARGTVGSGGAMTLVRETSAVINRSTFARNSAQRWGGALFLHGSAVQIADSRFLDNEVSPGEPESASQSRGAAIFSMPLNDPNHPRNVGGVVSTSVFAANVGIPIFDNEPASGPFNTMRYDNNSFYSTSFGALVYVHNKLAPGGASASELNGLPGKGSGNTRLTSAPRLGTVLAVPPFLGTGASGAPGRSFLAYAWSGRSATLAGQSLSRKAGLLEATAAGDYALAVEGTAVGSARVAASACTSGPRLCLNGDRFVAEVAWKDFQGKTGSGQAVSLTSDTGYFWFFSESNVELVVKVLDGRPLNGSFWVFYGSLSNVEYTLTITDTVTGRVRSYRNPAGRMASAGDTSAFPVGPAGKTATLASADAEPPSLAPVPAVAANCAPGPTDLCLNGGRFRVSLAWKAQGTQGAGQAVPLTSDTGYFWFFSPTNVEVAIKVLDGRPLNGHFWVFYGALSNVEYTITVTDTETGRSVTYKNPAGQFGSRADTSALPD